MEYKIRIKKDTPFHKEGELLSIVNFRAAYSWICTNTTTNEELVKYIKVEHKARWASSKPPSNRAYELQIGDWFEVIEIWDPLPLCFVLEDLWWYKDFDGTYAAFLSPTHFKGYVSSRENNICVRRMTIDQATTAIQQAKYRQQVLYCTNDINKKL